MNKVHKDEASNTKIAITFILLVITIVAYVVVNKYIAADPAETEETIVDKTGDNEMSEKDALKLGTEKYYLAIATITNTKSDINKVYNAIETTEIVLEDEALINSLNNFKNKTYALNSSVELISNYDNAITKNFTEDIINKYIISPNGFIGNINNDYYIVKEKIDNYFFKEADLKLMSITENELYFKVVNTNYASTCAAHGNTTPSITCTDTKEGNALDFRLVKDGKNWKISEITLTTA